MKPKIVEQPWYFAPRRRSVDVAQSGTHIKIGLSHQPKKRCEELTDAHGNPLPVTLLRSWVCENAGPIETALHKRFAEYLDASLGREKEWYLLLPEVLETLLGPWGHQRSCKK